MSPPDGSTAGDAFCTTGMETACTPDTIFTFPARASLALLASTVTLTDPLFDVVPVEFTFIQLSSE